MGADPRPVILVGAARSGTKMLRDTLATAPGVGCVPYDINYVWRRGNEKAPDDAFDADRSQTANIPFIRRYVFGEAAGEQAVIEKTVATGLRLPFVDRVFPEAQYIFLVRDPIDLVPSAMKEWTAKTDWRYSAKKALSYPWLAAPGYASRQVLATARRIVRPDDTPTPWGPVYPGMMREIAEGRPLVEICSEQWNTCNSAALTGFGQIGRTPVFVRYEALCRDPEPELARICAALDLPPVPAATVAGISAASVGSGRSKLSQQEQDTITGITEDTARRIAEVYG